MSPKITSLQQLIHLRHMMQLYPLIIAIEN
jgi:hypothetical protein